MTPFSGSRPTEIPSVHRNVYSSSSTIPNTNTMHPTSSYNATTPVGALLGSDHSYPMSSSLPMSSALASSSSSTATQLQSQSHNNIVATNSRRNSRLGGHLDGYGLPPAGLVVGSDSSVNDAAASEVIRFALFKFLV